MLKNENYRLEWCIDDALTCLPKFHLVDQIEWCSRLDLNGLTPDIKQAKIVKQQSTVPVKVMLRCREGDFVYTKTEVDDMIETGLQFRELGYDRFVFGAICGGRLDLEAINRVTAALAPASICVHKAIDDSDDILSDLVLLAEIGGINEILSSGGAATAMQGAEVLKAMHDLAPPEITIIGAGKITRQNVSDHHAVLGLRLYHGKRMV